MGQSEFHVILLLPRGLTVVEAAISMRYIGMQQPYTLMTQPFAVKWFR